MVKLKMIDSSDKIELGQTKWLTEMRWRLKLLPKFKYKDFITKQNTKLSKSYQTSYHQVCQIRNIHTILEVKNIIQTWADWIEIPEMIRDGMTKLKSQLKKSILNFRQYYEAKREVGYCKTS